MYKLALKILKISVKQLAPKIPKKISVKKLALKIVLKIIPLK